MNPQQIKHIGPAGRGKTAQMFDALQAAAAAGPWTLAFDGSDEAGNRIAAQQARVAAQQARERMSGRETATEEAQA